MLFVTTHHHWKLANPRIICEGLTTTSIGQIRKSALLIRQISTIWRSCVDERDQCIGRSTFKILFEVKAELYITPFVGPNTRMWVSKHSSSIMFNLN